MKPSKENIMKKLKNGHSTWDVLLELHSITDAALLFQLGDTIHQLNWIVRWFYIDKIDTFTIPQKNPLLFSFVSDPDHHVSTKAQETLKKDIKDISIDHIKNLDHSSKEVRALTLELIKQKGSVIVPFLFKNIDNHSWIISNRLIYLIWELLGKNSDHYLIKSLKYKSTTKHALTLLSFLDNKTHIPIFIQQFAQPSLRQHVLLCVKNMNLDMVIPELIRLLQIPPLNTDIKTLLEKIGSPCVPYLIKASTHSSLTRAFIMPLLKKIPFTMSQYTDLTKTIDENPFPFLMPVEQFKPKDFGA